MSETNIRWASHTLNFYDWHCNKVSEGCKFCYAETLAKKYGKTFEGAPNWRGANAYKELRRAGLKWVIVGGESGEKRRAFEKVWAEQIRQWCEKAVVPFMFKQGSAFRSEADRLLNGCTYDETPFGQFKAAPKSDMPTEGKSRAKTLPPPLDPKEAEQAAALAKLARWNAAVKGEQP